jgi:hypothetical protein
LQWFILYVMVLCLSLKLLGVNDTLFYYGCWHTFAGLDRQPAS